MGKSASFCMYRFVLYIIQELWFYAFTINTNNLYIWKYIILSLVYF